MSRFTCFTRSLPVCATLACLFAAQTGQAATIGDLYVSDGAGVKEYSPTLTYGSSSGYGSGLPTSSPGIAFGPDGDLYVVNPATNQINVYNSTGTTLVTMLSTNLINPIGLTFDNTGNLYVANGSGGNVIKFAAAAGGSVNPNSTIFAAIPAAPLGSTPAYLAFGDGSIWVTDPNNSVAYKYSLAGVKQQTITNGSFNAPTGIAVNSYGNIFITDPGARDLFEYNYNSITNQAVFDTIVATHTTNGDLVNPQGVTTDGVLGDVFVADTSGHHIDEYNPQGLLVNPIPDAQGPIDPAFAPEPGALAFFSASVAISGILLKKRQRGRAGRRAV